MTDTHKKQLWTLALVIIIGVPLELTTWILVGRTLDLDVTTICHFAGVSSPPNGSPVAVAHAATDASATTKRTLDRTAAG